MINTNYLSTALSTVDEVMLLMESAKLLILFTIKPSAPCESVRHTVVWVEEASKRKKLITFLKDRKQFRFVSDVCVVRV